jgi:hypothetical protein
MKMVTTIYCSDVGVGKLELILRLSELFELVKTPESLMSMELDEAEYRVMPLIIVITFMVPVLIVISGVKEGKLYEELLAIFTPPENLFDI